MLKLSPGRSPVLLKYALFQVQLAGRLLLRTWPASFEFCSMVDSGFLMQIIRLLYVSRKEKKTCLRGFARQAAVSGKKLIKQLTENRVPGAIIKKVK
jgi:hypothetical protein